MTTRNDPAGEDYVSLATAKALKEKGFNIPCHYESHGFEGLSYHRKAKNFNGPEYSGLNNQWYSRPSLYVVQKWLREEKGVSVEISDLTDYNTATGIYTPAGYRYLVHFRKTHAINQEFPHYLDTRVPGLPYETALAEGIDKALEIL